MKKKKRKQVICLCNNVTKDTIEESVKKYHLEKIDEIFDKTTAGVGACGGSCRPLLKKILDHYLQKGEFLKTIHDPRMKRKK